MVERVRPLLLLVLLALLLPLLLAGRHRCWRWWSVSFSSTPPFLERRGNLAEERRKPLSLMCYFFLCLSSLFHSALCLPFPALVFPGLARPLVSRAPAVTARPSRRRTRPRRRRRASAVHCAPASTGARLARVWGLACGAPVATVAPRGPRSSQAAPASSRRPFCPLLDFPPRPVPPC